MSEFQPGEWSYRKCPAPQIAVSASDEGTLWFVQFDDLAGGWRGEVAITQGEHAKAHAQLFAAARDLLEACQAFADWDEIPYASEAAVARLRRMVDAAIAKATAAPEPARDDDDDRMLDAIYA